MTIRNLIVAVGLLPAIFMLSGCLGMAHRALATKTASYDEVAMQAGPVQGDQVRLWLYVVGGEPNIFNTMGAQDIITLNDQAYAYSGETFRYLDLAAGPYIITTTDTVGFLHLRQGKIRKDVHLDAGKEYFLRVRYSRSEAPFDLVDRAEALPEMAQLKYDTAAKPHNWKKIKMKELAPAPAGA